MKKFTLFLTAIFLFQFLFAQVNDKITERLAEAISKAGENKSIKAIVVLKNQYPIWELDEQLDVNKVSLQKRAYTVIAELQQHAESSQKDILTFLNSKSKDKVTKFKNFWITNLFSLEVTKDILIELSLRPDILSIDLDEFLPIIDSIEIKPALKYLGNAGENLKIINAHKMWAEGFTGEGVIVANLDTGVDGNHPALNANWHGNNVPWEQAWFDAFQGTSFPTDPAGSQAQAGHGTATMGILVGLDPELSDTIGVAFNSQWIAGRSQFPVTGNIAQHLECLEWIIDPDGNPSTIEDMPAVLNNSWGVGLDCITQLDNSLQAIEAAGIAVIWAAGNFGPDPSTVAAPAKQNHTEMQNFSVGGITNYDPEFPIDPWSSRGPTPCNNGTGNNIKPEITAPIAARTSYLNGEYYDGKGTSIATPHVAGAIALLKEAFPEKTGTELKWMLYGSALDLGDPGEDNDYGMGVLDVWAAYQYQPSPEDPRRPLSVIDYSDYTTPNTVSISWTDPTQFIGGNTLTDFEIQISRDGEIITNVSSGTESYLDEGLIDGQQYEYMLLTNDLISDSLSMPVTSFGYSGGSPFPAPPTNLECTFTGDNVKLQWTDPVTQSDGTFLDDLDQVLIFRNDILVDSVVAATEIYYDDPPENFTAHYTLVAADSEAPVNFSDKSEMIPCFAGDCPGYIVWVGPDALLESKYSGDSLYKTLLDLYRPVFKSNNLFEFGNDLNQHEVIFVALGNFPYLHVLKTNGQEASALEDFLFNGGKLYIEGGFAFDPFPNPWFPEAYDIHPWFGLGTGNAGSGDVTGIIGQNSLSDFTFDYIGINNFMNELNPELSTAIWKNSQNEDICGVFSDSYGSGKAIGVTTPFGSLKSDTHTKKDLMEAYLQLFDIVISGTPGNSNVDFGPGIIFNVYPNPVNINLTMEFLFQHTDFATIIIYDVYGKQIAKVASKNFEQGNYKINWNAEGLNEGVYFIRLETKNSSIVQKAIILN